MDAEASNDFVKDYRGPRLRGQLAQRLQELPWTEVRPPALHGFDQDRRQFMDVPFEPGEALGGSIVQDGDVGDGFGRNTRSDRKYPRNPLANAASRQHFVELAVIVASEIDDPVAPGHRSRDPHRRHHRFGSGVAKGHPLVAREIAKELRDFAGERRLRAQFKALVDLRDERFTNEIGRVTKGGRTKAVQEIDINVAIDIPKFRAFGADGDDRVNDLL